MVRLLDPAAKRRWRRTVFAGLPFLLALAPARAQPPSCAELAATGLGAIQSIQLLEASDCLGGARDEDEVAREIRTMISEISPDVMARREAVGAILDQLALRAQESALEAPDSPLPALIASVRDAAARLGSDAPITFPGTWEIELAATPPVLSRAVPVRLDDFLSGPCDAAAPPAACERAFAAASDAVRFTVLARDVLFLWHSDELAAAFERIALLERQWDAYFNEARSQYLWELWINGRIVEKRYPHPALPGGLRGGYREVPREQWIVAHPGLALEYVDGAEDGSRQKAVAVLELLGYNRWKFREDGSMGGALGVSIAFTASDRAGVAEEGWGLLIHLNHDYTLGVTRHDDETGYVLSADLAKLWTSVKERRRAAFAGLAPKG